MPRWESTQGWASQAVLPLRTASGPLYVVSLGERDFLCGSSKSEGSEKQGVEASRLTAWCSFHYILLVKEVTELTQI